MCRIEATVERATQAINVLSWMIWSATAAANVNIARQRAARIRVRSGARCKVVGALTTDVGSIPHVRVELGDGSVWFSRCWSQRCCESVKRVP